MAYTPNPTWVDGAAGGTPITAATLQHIEDGIAAAAAAADAASDGLDGKQALRGGDATHVNIGLVTSSSNNAHKVWDMHAAATRPPLRYPSSYRRVSGVWRPA